MSALPTIPATASECIGCSANIMAEKKTLNLEAFSQGNILRGIDNCSSAAQSVVQVR